MDIKQMGKVFVVQNQHRWDKGQNCLVPKFDISSAEEYGEMVPLLSPTAAPFRPAPIIAEMQRKLAEFCDDDYLLLIGNPVLIGCATAIAAQANFGRVKMLQWSGTDQRYTPVGVSVGQEDGPWQK